MTNTECAKQITKVARSWASNANEPDVRKERSLANAYRSDAGQLRAVAALVRQGRRKVAARIAERLDTIVRELIPQKAWDHLQAP